jgi:hypothetical protein
MSLKKELWDDLKGGLAIMLLLIAMIGLGSSWLNDNESAPALPFRVMVDVQGLELAKTHSCVSVKYSPEEKVVGLSVEDRGGSWTINPFHLTEFGLARWNDTALLANCPLRVKTEDGKLILYQE